MADISRTGLRHIESGETSPTLYSLLKLSKALTVDLAELLSAERPALPAKQARRRK